MEDSLLKYFAAAKGIAGASLKGVRGGGCLHSERIVVIVKKDHLRVAKVISGHLSNAHSWFYDVFRDMRYNVTELFPAQKIDHLFR
jgi:hypothetical protein